MKIGNIHSRLSLWDWLLSPFLQIKIDYRISFPLIQQQLNIPNQNIKMLIDTLNQVSLLFQHRLVQTRPFTRYQTVKLKEPHQTEIQ